MKHEKDFQWSQEGSAPEGAGLIDEKAREGLVHPQDRRSLLETVILHGDIFP